MAKLIVVSALGRPEFELGAVSTLGRHPGNTIQILDRIVSKEHAQVIQDPSGGFILRDLGSLNGTFVGGERVHGDRPLHEGDEITMGTTRLVFQNPQMSPSLQRVTILPTKEDFVQRRIRADREFLPEKEIADTEVLRHDYEKLRVAYELGRSIGFEVDLEKLFQKILDRVFDLLPAQRGVILLMNEQNEPVPRYAKAKDGRIDEITISNVVLNEVIRERAAVLSSDAMIDSRFSGSHSVILQGIRSIMCVPLEYGDTLFGIMHLDSQIAANAFTEKDLQLLTGIAKQTAVAIENARLGAKIEREAQKRAQFERLLSPNLVEQVVSGELVLEKGGKRRDVSILFADIRGFTAMTERSQPEEIVSLLNEYFEVMVDVLFQCEGTLDKFVGDEIMALFGAPLPMDNAPLQAVTCALLMQRGLSEFNRTRLAEGQEPIRIGIGIDTGPVVTGAIGSSRALQYTAIGDAVNTASRLCAQAEPGQILITDATLKLIRGKVDVVALPPMQLRGKQETSSVYTVKGFRSSLRDITKPSG